MLKTGRLRKQCSGSWFAGAVLVFMPLPASAYLTDTDIHTEPPAPSLPSAGSKAFDPTFGTEIIRLTDNNDSSVDCSVGYSNRPSFNVNNTYVGAWCTVSGSNRWIIWDWNAANNTFSNKRLQSNRVPGLQDYGIQWSKTTASKYYACARRVLWEVNVPNGASTTFTNTQVKDFGSTIGGVDTDYCTQIRLACTSES